MATSPAHHSSARRRARYRLAGAALAVMLLAPLTALGAPTASAAPKREKLEMYTLEGTPARSPRPPAGVELAGVRQTASGHPGRRRPDREPAREAGRGRRQGRR